LSSVSTGAFGRLDGLPEIAWHAVFVIAKLLIEPTLFRVAFDGAAKFHAALIFLLTAGFDGAVRVIVVPRHILSPNTLCGSVRMGANGDKSTAQW
jgi:hypothetical protein